MVNKLVITVGIKLPYASLPDRLFLGPVVVDGKAMGIVDISVLRQGSSADT
jgi:hypothetical protein